MQIWCSRFAACSALFFALTGAAVAAEATLTGPAAIVDGDTVQIGGVKVRFKGVSAPERGTQEGKAASAYLRSLIGESPVRCDLTGETTRGWGKGEVRPVGFCHANGHDLNRSMVESGYALACPHWDVRGYAKLEPATGTAKRAGYRLPGYCKKQ